MRILRKYSLLLAPLAMTGCATVPVAGETCLSLADAFADAATIRAGTASDALGGKSLCDGLADLREKEFGLARLRLGAALKRANPDQRWPIQGYLAKAEWLDQLGELALRNWELAIKASVRAKDKRREALFRGDRGTYYAQRKQFDRALDDLAKAYEQADEPAIKAQMTYSAFKVAVAMENLELMRHWYSLAMAACEAVGDGEKLAYITEYYGQVLDKQQDFAASDTVYRQGINAVRRTGNLAALADVLEFHGQSRYAAGDRIGGRESYGLSRQIYGSTGHGDYAEFMARNARAKEARIEREIQED